MKIGTYEIGDNMLQILWILVVFSMIGIGSWHEDNEKTKRIESCNALKAQAIAASQPTPQCAF